MRSAAGALGLPDQPLPGERSIAITRSLVTAFFDTHLKDRRRPVLDRPSETFPEVKTW
ncbi:hypothetical protein [Nonomuraea longicatena]|uniref:hypothetical protein n=1 Tax=Nonomuraea longicatena TaxID=83682 RepID=UPI0031CE0B04